MKRYLDFTLSGKEFFPIWIIFFILFILPYTAAVYQIQQAYPEPRAIAWYVAVMIVLVIIAVILTYYITRLLISRTAFDGNVLVFNGTLGKFLGIFFLGLLLTIITLGIYSPWFVRNIQRFFVGETQLKKENFKFLGEGGKLFVIALLALILPMAILTIIFGKSFMTQELTVSPTKALYNLLTTFVLIPYYYFVYKWLVDIQYKKYHICWETEFWPSFGKILVEFILVVITVGIYMPAAMVKLYGWFAQRTVAKSEEKNLRFGYELEAGKDFLFIWGQVLLSIITITIYLPWAYAKIGKRILSKTYLAEDK
jgi:uncharacterized membrane protein YjgN (DUF898 family)